MLPGLLLLGKKSVGNRSNPTNNDSSTASKVLKINNLELNHDSKI